MFVVNLAISDLCMMTSMVSIYREFFAILLHTISFIVDINSPVGISIIVNPEENFLCLSNNAHMNDFKSFCRNKL
jgi:hypothetical protein